MPATQPTIANPAAYRQIEFVAGRILQAREVQSVQSLIGDEPAENTYQFGALFPQGMPLNITPTISMSGGVATVTLTATNSHQPMLVYVNNRFERVDTSGPVTVTYSSAANGTVVTLYANWVLWRVTYNGDRGSIQDATLVDSDTQEAVGELGQLALYFGPDYSASVPNPTGTSYTIFNQNTTPLPMFTFTWQNSVLVWTGTTTCQPGALATLQRAGLVTTTTANTQVVSTDDPRNTNARIPVTASVNSQSVSSPVATGGSAGLAYTDQNGVVQGYTAPAVTTNDNSGGIDANRVWYASWRTTLDNCLGFIGAQISNMWGVLLAYGQRLTALENKPTVDYSWHIGTPLGRVGPLKTSHQPIIDNNDPATIFNTFKVISSQNYSPAFQCMAGDYSTVYSQIDFNGNYIVNNPAFQSVLKHGSFDFTNYFNMAQQLLGWIATPIIPGNSIITGVRTQGSVNGTYVIFTFGGVYPNDWEIGIGTGTVSNGGTVSLPQFFTQGMILNLGIRQLDVTSGNQLDHLSMNWSGLQVTTDASDNAGHHFPPTVQYTAICWRNGA